VRKTEHKRMSSTMLPQAKAHATLATA
jgi:hypothetical protein